MPPLSKRRSTKLPWEPICTTHFPSLSYNLKLINPSLPYYRLYAMASDAAKRRSQTPSKPSLALNDLIFTVNVFSHNKVLFSLEKPGDELVVDGNGVFKFDIDVDNYELEAVASESVRITWNVVLKGWRGVFNMMESCKGKRGVDDWWFSEELPLPGCCSSLVDSGVVAELRLVLTDESKMGGNNVDHVARINKVSVGMFNTAKLRYVGVEYQNDIFIILKSDMAHYEPDIRIGLKMWTSLRSPPSDVDDGASPPEQTLEASPTTFPSW
ncbi:hypothetical protein ACLB2K_041902 [Fragaria x ananassa]